MRKQNNKSGIRAALLIFVIILATSITLSGCKKQPDEKTQSEQHPGRYTTPEPTAESPGQAAKSPTDTTTHPQKTLNDIIRTAGTWGPAYESWQGKHAPDFTLSDINGKQHKLSDYRGKNVMLIFWAPWCSPCIKEIPNLIELRKTTSKDNLAMLAISYIGPRNSTETVKRFLAANPVINYTVISTSVKNMPRPYNLVNSIPSSFFIDPDGKIKLATVGLIPLNDIKAVLQAK